MPNGLTSTHPNIANALRSLQVPMEPTPHALSALGDGEHRVLVNGIDGTAIGLRVKKQGAVVQISVNGRLWSPVAPSGEFKINQSDSDYHSSKGFGVLTLQGRRLTADVDATSVTALPGSSNGMVAPSSSATRFLGHGVAGALASTLAQSGLDYVEVPMTGTQSSSAWAHTFNPRDAGHALASAQNVHETVRVGLHLGQLVVAVPASLLGTQGAPLTMNVLPNGRARGQLLGGGSVDASLQNGVLELKIQRGGGQVSPHGAMGTNITTTLRGSVQL